MSTTGDQTPNKSINAENLTFRDVADWLANLPVETIEATGLEMFGDLGLVKLVMSAHVGKASGHLQDEVLANLGYRPVGTDDKYSRETLSTALADMVVLLLLLAENIGIDLPRILVDKIGALTTRQF